MAVSKYMCMKRPFELLNHRSKNGLYEVNNAMLIIRVEVLWMVIFPFYYNKENMHMVSLPWTHQWLYYFKFSSIVNSRIWSCFCRWSYVSSARTVDSYTVMGVPTMSGSSAVMFNCSILPKTFSHGIWTCTHTSLGLVSFLGIAPLFLHIWLTYDICLPPCITFLAPLFHCTSQRRMTYKPCVLIRNIMSYHFEYRISASPFLNSSLVDHWCPFWWYALCLLYGLILFTTSRTFQTQCSRNCGKH